MRGRMRRKRAWQSVNGEERKKTEVEPPRKNRADQTENGAKRGRRGERPRIEQRRRGCLSPEGTRLVTESERISDAARSASGRIEIGRAIEIQRKGCPLPSVPLVQKDLNKKRKTGLAR